MASRAVEPMVRVNKLIIMGKAGGAEEREFYVAWSYRGIL